MRQGRGGITGALRRETARHRGFVGATPKGAIVNDIGAACLKARPDTKLLLLSTLVHFVPGELSARPGVFEAPKQLLDSLSRGMGRLDG